MPDRPHVIGLMQSSLDGGLHPSRFTASPDGTVKDWSSLYERLHDQLAADAWLVGRTTMAEMAKGESHPPGEVGKVDRPHYIAHRDARSYAIAVDTRGQLHFRGGEVGGDHVVVLLGATVGDAHLAELASDGVSYIVSPSEHVDLAGSLATLRRALGIERLLIEGGATILGNFLAQGLVDELNVIIAPALDARADMEGFVVADTEGLSGKLQLSLLAADRLDHGAVHLRYAVLPTTG